MELEAYVVGTEAYSAKLDAYSTKIDAYSYPYRSLIKNIRNARERKSAFFRCFSLPNKTKPRQSFAIFKKSLTFALRKTEEPQK